jgi:hypothetical protein
MAHFRKKRGWNQTTSNKIVLRPDYSPTPLFPLFALFFSLRGRPAGATYSPIPTSMPSQFATPFSKRSFAGFMLYLAFASASSPVINVHFDVSRIPETSKSVMLLSPANDWNGVKRLNEWNGPVPMMNVAKRWNDWNELTDYFERLNLERLNRRWNCPAFIS